MILLWRHREWERKGKFHPGVVLWRMFLSVRSVTRGARHAAKLA